MTSDDILNRFDDFLNDGRAAGVEPSLAETASRFQAMDARDREPDPHPDFLRQLQENLMNQALAQPSAISYQLSAGHVASPARRLAAPLSDWDRHSPLRRAWPHLAAAAIILLALGAGVLAYRLAPNDPDRTPTLPAAAQTTPASDIPAVDIAECATERRPDGTVVGFVEGTPATTRVLPPLADRDAEVDVEALLADKPEADAETVAGIEQAARQLTACRFDAVQRDLGAADYRNDPDLDGPYFALYSDDFFRRELFRSEMNGAVVLPEIWTPHDPLGLTIETPRALPDGRVATVFSSSQGQWPDAVIAIFAKQGDRWLVDEYRWIGGATSAPAVRSQILEILLWDHEGAIFDYQNVIGGTFHANEPVILTIANLGTRPHRVVIDELGIDVEAQPGHSRTFTFTPARGAYGVASAVIDEAGQFQPVPILPGELVFASPAEGTPEASPVGEGMLPTPQG